MKPIDVSIVLVNWNTREFLCGCLDSLYESKPISSFEIIVVDNASSDGSVEMVKSRFPGVEVIANKVNRGFASANNQGISVSKGRYVLLLNSDTEVLADSIDKVVAFADAHKRAAVVGCRVLYGDMTLQPTCFMFPSILNMLLSASYLYKLFRGSRFFGREQMSWWDRDDVRPVDVVTGCFMLVRGRAIRQVGLLDEQFFMYAEEADWCYRFKQAGWSIMFTPESRIIHFGGRSSRKVRVEMLIQLRLSILQFIGKHHGWLSHKIAGFLTILFFAVRLPVWFFISLFDSGYKKMATAKLNAYARGIGQVFLRASNKQRANACP